MFAHPSFAKFSSKNAAGVVEAALKAMLTGLSWARIEGVKRRIHRIAARRAFISYRLRTSAATIPSMSRQIVRSAHIH
jgi:hypothetical protein